MMLFSVITCYAFLSPSANFGQSQSQAVVAAQTPSQVVSDTTQPLAEVQIVQQIANKYIPLPHTILKSQALLRDDGVQLAPALNRVPGVYMQTGTLSTNRVVIRGIGSRSTFSTNKLRAYLDDIPLTDGTGETAIEDIDLSLLKEVRVYKGPSASLYGAGLGGVVVLRTDNQPIAARKLKLMSSTTIGSFGLVRSALTLGFGLKKTTGWVNYNLTHTDGWRENNRYDRSGLTAYLRHDWRKAGTSSVFIQGFQHLRGYIPSSLNINDFKSNPRMANPGWLGVRGNEHTDKNLISAAHSMSYGQLRKMRIMHQSSVFYKTRTTDELRPFNQLIEDSRILGLRSQISLQYPDQLSMPFPLVAIGIEHMKELYDWTQKAQVQVFGNERRLITNGFLQSYFSPLNGVRLLLGTNLNTTRYETRTGTDGSNMVRDSGEYKFNPVLSPHLGLSWQVVHWAQVFGTLSHGFSAPSLAETLTPEGAINPNIKPETGLNRELGMRLQNALLRSEISYHDMLVRNLLVAERVGPDQYVGVNAGRTRHRGIEAELHTTLPKQVNGFVTYTFTRYRFEEFTHRDQVYDGNRLPGIAPHHVQLGLDWQHRKGFFANASLQYLSAYPVNDANTVDNEAFTVVHTQAGYRHKLLGSNLEWRAGVLNLLDARYASMTLVNARSFGGALPRYYYPGAPRSWYLSLALRI